MGLGLVKAPRAESVPALRVLETPSAGSRKNRETGSMRPGGVSRKRRLEMGVWSVRALSVMSSGSQRRR